MRIVRTVGASALGVVLLATAAGAQERDNPTFTRDIAPILQRSCENCHRAEGVVLAVHPISRLTGGVGYRQRRLRPGSALVVVGGGTSHGVALAAPDPNPPARRRAANAADALLLAAGRARSPFLWNGTHLAFAETPHASVSLVVVPRGVRPPAVGESLACRVRTTTTRFDQITGL